MEDTTQHSPMDFEAKSETADHAGHEEWAMKRGFLAAVVAVLACAGSVLAGGEPDGSLRTWVDAEYLLWWLRPAGVDVPLLTTGPLTNPIAAGSGVLGNPTTSVLAGNQAFNQGPYSGFRIGAGWIQCDDSFGVEGNFFYLSQRARDLPFTSDSSGNPLLARPVVDARTGAETVLFVAAPNAFSGAADISSSTLLFGFDANGVLPVRRGCCDDEVNCWVNMLGGFRYLNLRDDLSIASNTSVLPGGITFFDGLPVTFPGTLAVNDNFRTLNQFYGGQIGAQAGVTWWLFTVNAVGKVAVGSMREEASISGSTTAGIFGTAPQTVSGGLLAGSSNIGSHTRNMLAVVPEGQLNFQVEITPSIKLMLGYTILYVSNVQRPGQLLDRQVNRTTLPSSELFNPAIPGPNRPGFSWAGTDFWAQGVNFGIGLRF